MLADVVWIDRADHLRELADRLRVTSLGFDTEADSFHRYREKLCLLQLSFDSCHALIDPLADLDLSPVRPIFENPAVRKIVHGGDFDVRILRRDAAIGVRGLFDTMVAARLCGETSLGLSALLERFVGVRLDKSMQRADWSRRPLADAMIAYAVDDTRHLQALAELFEDRLAALGRTAWAEEEFERLESVRWGPAVSEPEPFRRVKGAAALEPRPLAILAQLWEWRDARARRLDKPPFKVLRDEAMVTIAANPPSDRDALGKWVGGGPGRARSSACQEVWEAIERGLATPDERLPARADGRRARNDPAFDRRVADLKRRRDAVARELGVEGSVVAARAVLEAIQRKIDEGADPEAVPELRSWQWNLLRGHLP